MSTGQPIQKPTHFNFRDITGKTFGRIKVLEYVGRGIHGGRNGVFWKCFCIKCGKIYPKLETTNVKSVGKSKCIPDKMKLAKKVCSKCGVEKNLEDFPNFIKRKKDGVQTKRPECKECMKKYLAEHYKKNKAARKEWAKEYRTKNRDACNKTVKEWRKKNPEKSKASSRNYFKKHPDKLRAMHAKRRALENKAPLGDLKAITAWEATWRKAKSVECYWCGKKFPGKKCRPDHVIPLSRGGAHSLENLVTACHSCNSSKHAKMPDKFNAELEQPRLFW
jgi:Restriction endonuclease